MTLHVREIRVAGYRSLRRLRLSLHPVTVVTGPNGCGKSNLYRALWLLRQIACGEFSQAIAGEGGTGSMLWAGPREKGPVRLSLGASVGDWRYEITVGLAAFAESVFKEDPAIKEERLEFVGNKRKPVPFLRRDARGVLVRDGKGNLAPYAEGLSHTDPAISELRDPHRFPELGAFREAVRGWRFYHHFRSDAAAPMRFPQVAAQAPVLSHDGSNLARCLATIMKSDPATPLHEYIGEAFPGARLRVVETAEGLTLEMDTPGLHRPLSVREFSDGILRYLCLLAALLTPRPPLLLALNEPETSLHPSLLEPLAQLIGRASQRSQIWVTTHAASLARAIAAETGPPPVELCLEEGATKVVGQGLLD